MLKFLYSNSYSNAYIGFDHMNNILLMDFELNKPLTLLNKFKTFLRNEGWAVDMFLAKDYSDGKKPSLDDKINSAQFILIRKPLTFLNSPKVTKKLQDAVLKDKKSLLLMLTFLDKESLNLIQNFLKPFKITPSEIKIIDQITNLNNKRSVVYHKKNNCFVNDIFFKQVAKIVVPDANVLYIEPPSEVMIRGNPSTETTHIDLKNNDEIKSHAQT